MNAKRDLPAGIYQATNRRGVEVFKVRVSIGGKRQPQETFPTLREAKAHLHGLHAIAANGPAPSLWPAGTFDDLLQLVKDAHAAKDQTTPPLKHLIAFFTGVKIPAIRRPLLKRYVAARKVAGAAPASIKNELAALRYGFNIATKDELLGSAPSFKDLLPKIENTREGFFTFPLLRTFLAALPRHLRAPVEFAAITGWRKQNVLGLHWSQVDLERGVVRLREGTTKSGTPVEFPFRVMPRLRELLEAQHRAVAREERKRHCVIGYVFPYRGDRVKDVRTGWRQAVEATRIVFHQYDPKTKATKDVAPVFHDLRRTAATWLTEAGLDRKTIMKYCGWESEAVFTRYNIVSEDAGEQQIAKGGRFYEKQMARAAAAPKTAVLSFRKVHG